MNGKPDAPADGAARLHAHAADCDSCRATPLPHERLTRYLDQSSSRVNTALLSQQVLQRVRPELLRLSRIAWWRRVAASILLALLPLPLVLISDAYLLAYSYDLLRLVLPSGIALFMLASYSATIALLFAATYAAIPIVLARGFAPRIALSA